MLRRGGLLRSSEVFSCSFLLSSKHVLVGYRVNCVLPLDVVKVLMEGPGRMIANFSVLAAPVGSVRLSNTFRVPPRGHSIGRCVSNAQWHPGGCKSTRQVFRG